MQKHIKCVQLIVLRELNYLTELYNNKWSLDFKKLILRAIKLKREMASSDYKSLRNHERDKILLELERLLLQDENSKNKKLKTFQKRIKDYQDYLFTFLYEEGVPPDNNASERAVRNIKVKQKISGQFKNIKNAQNFAIIRSVIDTIIKNRQNIIEALKLIAQDNFVLTE